MGMANETVKRGICKWRAGMTLWAAFRVGCVMEIFGDGIGSDLYMIFLVEMIFV